MAQSNDPTFIVFMANSAGYAVFPAVGKGGLGVGGVYGRGLLYEKGNPVEYCDLRQAPSRALAGEQSYSEIICFETPKAVTDFRSGGLKLPADASAVTLRSGAAAMANYSNSVAVFTMNGAGVMGDVAISGQKFTVSPMNEPVPAGARLEPWE
jgi:lipid-binding SYLF domain-containing protein